MSAGKPLTLWSVLEAGRDFGEKGVPDAELDAWRLMEEVWQIRRAYYYAHRKDRLDEEAHEERLKRYGEYLQRRGRRSHCSTFWAAPGLWS